MLRSASVNSDHQIEIVDIWFRICILDHPTKYQLRPMYLKKRCPAYAFVRFLDLIKFGHICIFGRLKFCKLAPAFFHREHLLTKIESGAQLHQSPKSGIWSGIQEEVNVNTAVMCVSMLCPCCAHVVPMGKTVSRQNYDPRYRVNLCWPEKAINSSLNRFWFMASKSTPTIVQDCGWKVSLYATINQEPTTKIFSTFFTDML